PSPDGRDSMDPARGPRADSTSRATSTRPSPHGTDEAGWKRRRSARADSLRSRRDTANSSLAGRPVSAVNRATATTSITAYEIEEAMLAPAAPQAGVSGKLRAALVAMDAPAMRAALPGRPRWTMKYSAMIVA